MRLCNNNCTAWHAYAWGDGSAQDYQPDPDIAGVGVIIAYVASSFFTLCFALAYWTLTASTSPDQNLIDYWVFWFLSKLQLFKRTHRVRHFWVPVIEKVMLNLSDQQLLIGLSVLIAGFATHCSISAYHFAIVSDLAWFSSNVHLSTLTVLEGYLLNERGVRNWRVVSIMCMGILLIANNAMQGHWAWSESWSFDAQCLFDDLIGNWGGRPGYWAEVNIALIVVFYPMQILLLFDTTSEFIDEWLWVRPLKRIEALRPSCELVSSSRSNSMKLRYQGQRFIYTMAHVVYISVAALLGSRIVSYALDLFWFAYGVWSLKSDRSSAGDQMDGSENLLTFGQMMPLLLLSSTVFVFKETYEERKVEIENEKTAGGGTDPSHGYGSQQDLIQSRRSTSIASTSDHIELTMMGARQDEAEVSLRRPDTETRLEGRSQASGLENHDVRMQGPQLRRAPTLPIDAQLSG